MSEWLKNTVEILAAGGTLWAAISARQSAKTSAKQLEIQNQEQEKVERPRIIPLNKNFTAEIPFPLVDWSRDEHDELKTFVGPSKFSDFTIPIINTGKSFALNVRYYYELEGGIDSIESKIYNNHNIIGPSAEEKMQNLDSFEFRIRVTDTRHSPGRWSIFIAEVGSYVKSVPIVQSNSIEQLKIPSYFVALSNVYMTNWLNSPENELINPKLILTILYSDQYNNEHEEKFKMYLGSAMRIVGSVTEASIEFKQIKYDS